MQATDFVFLDSGKKMVTCSKDKVIRVRDLDTQHYLQIVGAITTRYGRWMLIVARSFWCLAWPIQELRVFKIRQSGEQGEDWNKLDALRH